MRTFIVLVLMVFIFGCTRTHQRPAGETSLSEGAEIEEVQRQIGVVEEEIPQVMPVEPALTVTEKNRFEFQDVLFDFDKYSIRLDARAGLDSTAAWLNNHKDIQILLEGHCDERGTNEYNLALGEKRAKAAKTYLASRGVSPTRMRSVSYGEERPVCIAHNESCWQKNRRAHTVVLR